MGFVFAAVPGFRHLSYAHCRLPRAEGGLGILDPVLEAQAIRAMWIPRLLLSEDAPWRHLLWAALQDEGFQLGSSTDVLARQWHKDKVATGKSPLAQLLCAILQAFSLLEPIGVVPLAGGVKRVYSPQLGRWTPASLSSIPDGASLASITVCGGVTLDKLSVKVAYAFLLRREMLLHVPAPTLPLINPWRWERRWQWLAKVFLPQPVRQLMWNRWHNRLYMGETREDPNPRCAFCPARATAYHCFKECRVAEAARDILQQCWVHWTGQEFADKWWKDEWSSDKAWMACFAFVMHALYIARIKAIKEDRNLNAAAAVANRFRASLECQLKSLCWWHRFQRDRQFQDEWRLNGAWLKEGEQQTFLVYNCSWPSPPF